MNTATQHPSITTYVSTQAEIDIAIQNGATSLILEDPRYSIRCLTQETESLTSLTAYARKINPNIHLSINCDLLTHTHHTPALENLIAILKETGITAVRLQDPGLYYFFKEALPDVTFHLNTETGNMNTESLTYYSTLFHGQTLAHDMPASEITKISHSIPCEIQVQGPILLQYSPRRFLQGFLTPHKTDITHHKKAQAHEYPGRTFVFHDNQHGHFMYLYFDKCLLKSLTELKALNLQSWLIDARGESLDYLKTALNAYTDIHSENTETYIKKLEELSKKPQKPGFFKINKTDQERKKKNTTTDTEIPVGTVIDALQKHSITLETTAPISSHDTLTLITPEGKRLPIQNITLTNCWGQPIESAQANELIQLPWLKGAQVKSLIVVIRKS